eukprot:COSAG01_NODE_31623_length_594_cov_1.042424_2_plen_117_part_01
MLSASPWVRLVRRPPSVLRRGTGHRTAQPPCCHERHSSTNGGGMCELRRGEVEAQIRQMAALTATPVSLQDLFKYGSCVSEKQRRANARFLHRELPLRIAQRVHELAMLPESSSESA